MKTFRTIVGIGFFGLMAVVATWAIVTSPGPVHWGRMLVFGVIASIPLVIKMRRADRNR